jgi:hypothetical protein
MNHTCRPPHKSSFLLDIYHITSYSIVFFFACRDSYHFFAIYSGVASLRKQSTYPGLLADSLVSDLDLVEICIVCSAF